MAGLRKYLALTAMVTLLLMAVLVWVSPTQDDFHMDNPYWNGGGAIIPRYSLVPLRSLSALPADPADAVLIVVPYSYFTADELRHVGSFVSGGGTLVLADDYGYGNRLLEYLGVTARFSSGVLLDPLVHYKNEWFPRATPIRASPVTDNISDLVLNHATGLTGLQTGQALAESSPFAFLDLSGNRIWDPGETIGPIPVMSEQNLGKGRLVLIADSSLFINSMDSLRDNGRLVKNLTSGAGQVFFDESHLTPSNLALSKELLYNIRTILISPPGTLAALVLAVAIVLLPLWRQKTRPAPDRV